MNTSLTTVLLIEDESPIRRFLRTTLSSHGYKLIEASTGGDGLKLASEHRPEVIILDLGLPDMDGIEVAQQIREWSSVPIIVLSARGQEQDKITALDAGADDYLTKPFGTGELLARIRAAQRRAKASDETEEPEFSVGELRVDRARRRVFVRNSEVHLTPNEYKLLSMLIKHAGKVVTHKQLLKEVWGQHYGTENHYVRVYMGQLRLKLEQDPARPEYLLTEPGVGYRLRAE